MIDAETGWYFIHTSVKVAIFDGAKTLLALNARDEWELVGGWPTADDESLEETVRRETLEETGLVIEELHLAHATLFEPVPTKKVALVVYAAEASSTNHLDLSDEHITLQWFEVEDLPFNLPEAYRTSIRLGFRTLYPNP
ncbi:hypothetical protein CKW39_05160 [Kocuria sp. WRN011]|uniref:NUDIX domain-containing protein n=1 Tax=Kocuria TaxID=57493 RepID=UPI000BAE723C|nr:MULTISPECIES: NUDIX hydrolase [Kocuria]MCT1803546.1 NUDIX hydrolase [Kocuria carniphila]PBB08959.1 hypothetical protein CKW39_05160 [Kocuria sp. WRN011]